MYDEDIRRKADHPNRREILVRVIAGIGIHRWRDRHRRRVTQQDRVPVGCGLRDETGSDRAIGAAFVLHHDCWPSIAESLSPTMRAMTVVLPPGGNGTTRVIGRLG